MAHFSLQHADVTQPASSSSSMPRYQAASRAGIRGRHLAASRATRLAACLAALCLLGGCHLTSAEDTEEQSVTLEAGKSVTLTTRNGRIDVRVGEPGRVLVKARKRARATSSPEALLKEIQVKITPGAEGVTIAAEHPKGGMSKQYGVDLEVRVPPGTPLRAETKNGAVRLTGTGAAIRAETRNGAVQVDDARGEVHLSTRNGAVHLSGQPSRFDAKSANGAIHVTLDPATALAGASSATTKNGAIILSLPATFRGHIDASTKNGKVESDFPLGGQAAPADPSLRLRTKNGSIQVRRR